MKQGIIFLIVFGFFLPAVFLGQEQNIISKLNQEYQQRLKVDYKYLLRLPMAYTGKEAMPLLIFLHGSGERGEDLNLVSVHGPWSFLDAHPEYPFVLLAPQCKQGEVWDPRKLDILIDEVVSSYHIDTTRIYITGLSMGGFGTWDLAMHDPARFAAIAPICGASNLHRLQAEKVRHIPIWVFHGALDQSVPFELSARVVKELEALGADVNFTVYPLAGHDSWTETYLNQELYDWFLLHTLGNSKI